MTWLEIWKRCPSSRAKAKALPKDQLLQILLQPLTLGVLLVLLILMRL